MRNRRICANERGFALGLAILCLLAVSGLVAWGVLLGLFSARAGRNTVAVAHAFAAAEEGARLQTAQGSWKEYAGLPDGGSARFTGSVLAGTGNYRGAVTRLSSQFFLVEAEGFDSRATARQRVGLLVWFEPLALEVAAAVEATGSVELRDHARVSGVDDPPAGGSCPAGGVPVAGIRVPQEDSSRVSTADCVDDECLRGAPAIATSAGDGSLGYPIRALEQFATIELWGGNLQLNPESSGGSCRADVTTNWGDPRATSDCRGHVPVIHAHGDLVVTGGVGQPLLIVDGNLLLLGDTYLEGLVLVVGKIELRERARVRGAVIVLNRTPESSVISRHAAIGYSSCAVQRALSAAGVPTLLPERSWIQLN